MTGIPAHCTKCGAVFVSPQLNFPNARGITIIDVGVSCPNCGGMADAIEGTFDFVGNFIKVYPGTPRRTIAILSVLQKALRESQEGAVDTAVIDTIAKASPALAKEISKKLSSHKGLILSGLLMALLAGCSQSINWNQMVDQVRVYSTGAEPYPNLGKQADAPKAENREQRRKQESLEKKKSKPTAPKLKPKS